MPYELVNLASNSTESLPSSMTCQKLTTTPILWSKSNKLASLIHNASGAEVWAAKSTIKLAFGLLSKVSII